MSVFLATNDALLCILSHIRAVSDRFLGHFSKKSSKFGQEWPFPGLRGLINFIILTKILNFSNFSWKLQTNLSWFSLTK